jgi:hypothetical protein
MISKYDLKEILKESPLFICVEDNDVDTIVENLFQHLLTISCAN